MITSIWTGPGGDASVARNLRQQVFCEELGLEPELAWDAGDPYAFHLVLMMDEVPVAAWALQNLAGFAWQKDTAARALATAW